MHAGEIIIIEGYALNRAVVRAHSDDVLFGEPLSCVGAYAGLREAGVELVREPEIEVSRPDQNDVSGAYLDAF